MPISNVTLGRAVLSGLVELREKKGKITLDDVGAMFLYISAEFHKKQTEHDQIMHEEIAQLASYIDESNREIFAISSNEKPEAAILDASLHLDEVIKATEQATNSIMDAADAIQQAAAGLDSDKASAIMDATQRIYEACNFQDITGQRINKVIKLLSNIEERVGKLNAMIINDAKEDVPLSEKDLLNGPALPGQGISQDDIDKLFASLGGNS